MKDVLPENLQKYENYKEQFQRLERALNNHFYLEAIFIEYAIMEDRTASILRYEGNSIVPKSENEHVTITRKINRIKKLAERKKSLPNRYFSDDLLDQVSAWVVQRNAMIHGLLKAVLTTEKLESLAAEGKSLARQLTNRAGNYKRAVDRFHKKIS